MHAFLKCHVLIERHSRRTTGGEGIRSKLAKTRQSEDKTNRCPSPSPPSSLLLQEQRRPVIRNVHPGGRGCRDFTWGPQTRAALCATDDQSGKGCYSNSIENALFPTCAGGEHNYVMYLPPQFSLAESQGEAEAAGVLRVVARWRGTAGRTRCVPPFPLYCRGAQGSTPISRSAQVSGNTQAFSPNGPHLFTIVL